MGPREVFSWPEYFASLLPAVARRSKDPGTQVGAIVSDADRSILSTGVNGAPQGVEDGILDWSSPVKHLFVIHAEVNALLFALAAVGRRVGKLEGCTLHCTHRPCSRCLLVAKQLRLTRVYYLADLLSPIQRIEAEQVGAITGIVPVQVGQM